MDKFRWAIDSIVCRDGVFFGYGWMFHEASEIRKLDLAVHFSDGQVETIKANLGQPREDVSRIFKLSKASQLPGYFFYGRYRRTPNRFDKLSLIGSLTNGESFFFEIPHHHYVADLGRPAATENILRLNGLLRRGLFAIKARQYSKVAEKTWHHIKAVRNSRSLDLSRLQKLLRPNETELVILLIDHNLGGGTNQYSNQLIKERIDEGATVVIFTFDVPTQDFVLKIKNRHVHQEFTFQEFDSIYKLVTQIEFKEIIYNNGVSFAYPDRIPKLIVELKRTYNPRLTLLIHDFFPICPSHCLLNDSGTFCNVPDSNSCQSCLPKNPQGFATLFQSRDIVQWRRLWASTLAIADEIRTFSDNSLKLLKRAYPSIDWSHATVQPHRVEYLNGVNISPSYTGSLRIGVVGTISYHKGSDVVKALSSEIKTRNVDVSIVIIGRIETPCDSSVVSQTGSYEHEQLPELIRQTGVNIMLFPSVWPETFSYVVQELIEMNLPVASFDLGAPAERLSAYPKGLILKEQDPSAILDALMAFHKQLYLDT